MHNERPRCQDNSVTTYNILLMQNQAFLQLTTTTKNIYINVEDYCTYIAIYIYIYTANIPQSQLNIYWSFHHINLVKNHFIVLVSKTWNFIKIQIKPYLRRLKLQQSLAITPFTISLVGLKPRVISTSHKCHYSPYKHTSSCHYKQHINKSLLNYTN